LTQRSTITGRALDRAGKPIAGRTSKPVWRDSLGGYEANDSQGDATSGESRGSFTALRYGAIHAIVSDAKSVAERYHWEHGPCRSFDHQSVTQGTLVRLPDV
jgi:hypothetical protein